MGTLINNTNAADERERERGEKEERRERKRQTFYVDVVDCMCVNFFNFSPFWEMPWIRCMFQLVFIIASCSAFNFFSAVAFFSSALHFSVLFEFHSGNIISLRV